MFKAIIDSKSHEDGLLASFTGSSPALGSIIVTVEDGTYIGKIDAVLGNTDKPIAHIAHLDRKMNIDLFLGCEAQIRPKAQRQDKREQWSRDSDRRERHSNRDGRERRHNNNQNRDSNGEITVETQIEEILTEAAQEDEISTDVILTEEAQEDEISTEEILTEEAQEDEISTEEILEIIDLITVKKRFIPIMIGLAKSAAMSTFHLEKNATDVESQEMNSLKASGIATVAISKERRPRKSDDAPRKFRKARGKSANHAHNRGPKPLNARPRRKNRDD